MINRHALFNEKAEWLWADLARHPDADRTPTTIFAPLPEGFRFRVFEFEKTYLRHVPSPGLLSVTVFADPRFRLWVNGVYIGTGPVAAGGDYAIESLMTRTTFGDKRLVRLDDSPDLALDVEKEAERHKGACLSAFYDPAKGLFSDGWTKSERDPAPNKWQPANADKRYYSRHANTLAVLAGFVTGETAKALAERVIAEDCLDKDSAIEIQPYFMHYVCEMAVKTGLWDKYALKLMHLWDRQVDDSPKGLKEGWGDFRGDCSHAWGGNAGLPATRRNKAEEAASYSN